MDYRAGAEIWLRVVLKDAAGEPFEGLTYNAAGLVIKYQQHGGVVKTKTLTAADWSEAVEGTYAVRFIPAETVPSGDFVYWAIYPEAITYEGLVRLEAAPASSSGDGDYPASGTELEQARYLLGVWKQALVTVSSGQYYQVGKMQLSRDDSGKCLTQIKYWTNEVARLERGGRRGARVMRVIPRDI